MASGEAAVFQKQTPRNPLTRRAEERAATRKRGRKHRGPRAARPLPSPPPPPSNPPRYAHLPRTPSHDSHYRHRHCHRAAQGGGEKTAAAEEEALHRAGSAKGSTAGVPPCLPPPVDASAWAGRERRLLVPPARPCPPCQLLWRLEALAALPRRARLLLKTIAVLTPPLCTHSLTPAATMLMLQLNGCRLAFLPAATASPRRRTPARPSTTRPRRGPRPSKPSRATSSRSSPQKR